MSDSTSFDHFDLAHYNFANPFRHLLPYFFHSIVHSIHHFIRGQWTVISVLLLRILLNKYSVSILYPFDWNNQGSDYMINNLYLVLYQFRDTKTTTEFISHLRMSIAFMELWKMISFCSFCLFHSLR